MKFLAMTGVLCATLLVVSASSIADDDFDVRDHLPVDDLFYLPNGLIVEWDGETLCIRQAAPSRSIPLLWWLDEQGRLEFAASDLSGTISAIEGRIDVLAGGEPEMYIDILYADATTESRKLAQVVAGSPFIAANTKCDCSDSITFGCKTNHCNSGTSCPHPADSYTCQWSSRNYVVFIPPSDVIETD